MTNRIIIIILSLMSLLLAQIEEDSLITYQSEDSVVIVANRYQVSAKALSYSYELITEDKILAEKLFPWRHLF